MSRTCRRLRAVPLLSSLLSHLLSAALAAALSAPGPGIATAEPCPWSDPVEAAVVDGFRPPSHPYGPGNRGLEYGVEPGQPVVAVAAGTVGFAGPVGGQRYVVVNHRRGLRSTYGPLARSAVSRGQQVAAGDPIGAAAAGLHLTARVGDRYIDPQPLLDGRCGRVRLVPTAGVPPGGTGAPGR